jgi:UDP-GlcNAc:undecaprenyl-phosphate GlcNAc-1-phosphate transferase
VLAALTAGAALGFLIHNFPPASSFMGDCGSNLLGLLMGVLTVEGTVKTPVVVSFALPLILLAVPFLDTTFVVLKRLKYHQPFYKPDSEHFHHRMARIGFSPRRTVFYLYGWTLLLAGLALALRFVPYSDHHGHLHTGWSLVMAVLAAVVVAASVYLIYVLEILKFKRLTAMRLRRLAPEASDAEIAASVAEELETGEFGVLTIDASAEQGVGKGKARGNQIGTERKRRHA